MASTVPVAKHSSQVRPSDNLSGSSLSGTLSNSIDSTYSKRLSGMANVQRYAPFVKTVRVDFNLTTPNEFDNSFEWLVKGLFQNDYAANTMTGQFTADLDLYFNPVTEAAVLVAIRFVDGDIDVTQLNFELDFQADGTATGMKGNLLNFASDVAFVEANKIAPQQIAMQLTQGTLASVGRNGQTSYDSSINFSSNPQALISGYEGSVLVEKLNTSSYQVRLRIPLSTEFNLLDNPAVPISATGQLVAQGSFSYQSDITSVPLRLLVNAQGNMVLSLLNVIPDVSYQIYWSLDSESWNSGPVVQGTDFPWTDNGSETAPLAGGSRFYKVVAVPVN